MVAPVSTQQENHPPRLRNILGVVLVLPQRITKKFGCGEQIVTSANPEEDEDVQQPLLKRKEEDGTGKEGQDVTTISLTCFACIALSAFLGDASRGQVAIHRAFSLFGRWFT